MSQPNGNHPHDTHASGDPILMFLEEVSAATAGNPRLEMCIQCGSCGGSCPSAADMDNSPRQLFAMVRAGLRDEVLSSNTPWICVSCYSCTVRCPQEINITDVMYTLKNISLREKTYKESVAPDFSVVFIDLVENYGRSYELGLATRHYLKHHKTRLPGMAPMGMGLLSKKRMDIKPKRIKGLAQLKAILDRARELEVVK